MKIIFKFLPVLFLFYCCNNWDYNTYTPQIPEESNPGIVYKMSSPENAESLYFLSEDEILLGTNDGAFYKSSDAGKSWKKSGSTISRCRINMFYYFEEGSGSTLKKYITAGTSKGIYMSSDMGESWNESFSEISAKGEYPDIYGFFKDFDAFLNRNVIIAIGGDGENNRFSSPDIGKTWTKSTLDNNYKSKIISFFSWIKIQSSSANVNILCGTSDSAKPFLVHAIFDYSVPKLVTGFYFNPNTIINSIILGKKNIYLCGSSNGIYEGNIERNTWVEKSLVGKNVYSLAQTADGMYLAGTDNGWFYSIDDGSS